MNKIIFILGCAVLLTGVILSAPHYPPVPRPVMVNPNGTLATSDTNFFVANSNLLSKVVGGGFSGVATAITNDAILGDGANAVQFHLELSGAMVLRAPDPPGDPVYSRLDAGAIYANNDFYGNLHGTADQVVGLTADAIAGGATTNLVIPGFGTLVFSNGLLQNP